MAKSKATAAQIMEALDSGEVLTDQSETSLLDDPNEQFKILNPETVTLRFIDGTSLQMKTELQIKDVLSNKAMFKINRFVNLAFSSVESLYSKEQDNVLFKIQAAMLKDSVQEALAEALSAFTGEPVDKFGYNLELVSSIQAATVFIAINKKQTEAAAQKKM